MAAALAIRWPPPSPRHRPKTGAGTVARRTSRNSNGMLGPGCAMGLRDVHCAPVSTAGRARSARLAAGLARSASGTVRKAKQQAERAQVEATKVTAGTDGGAEPLLIDLCCGSGGWAAGFIAAGWDVIGFDVTSSAGLSRGDWLLQDVRTIEGRRFWRARRLWLRLHVRSSRATCFRGQSGATLRLQT